MRVGIFGAAGAVGSATAAAVLSGRIADRLLLTDLHSDVLAVQHMDLDLLAGTLDARVEAVGRARLAEADLVVMAAGVPHRDGADRNDFAAANLAILDELLGALPARWPGALLIASNPVDVLATAAAQRLGPAARVLGYVANDTLRLAQAVAQVRGCPTGDVQAWTVGEHGPDTIALLDRVTVAGIPAGLDEAECREVVDRALGWYDRWQRHGTGRTSMWTTGAGVASLVASYTGARVGLEPVSVPLRGRYGVPGPVCLGVPALVGRGRAEVVEWALTGEQTERLHRTATGIARAARQAR